MFQDKAFTTIKKLVCAKETDDVFSNKKNKRKKLAAKVFVIETLIEM
jgi:hypothetical protein